MVHLQLLYTSDIFIQLFKLIRFLGVKFSSPEVNIVVLPNATIERVLNEVANAFRSVPKGVLLVYSGAICQSSASWILSDGVLKPDYIAGRISAASLKLQQTLVSSSSI